MTSSYLYRDLLKWGSIGILSILASCTLAAAEEFTDGLNIERLRLKQRITDGEKAKQKALHSLERAKNAIALAQGAKDTEAASIALQAAERSKSALARLNATLQRDTDRQAAIDRIIGQVETHRELEYGARAFISLREGAIHRSGNKNLDAPLLPGDMIETGSDGVLELSFPGGERIEMAPNTTLELVADAQGNQFLDLGKGIIRNLVRCLKNPAQQCRPYTVRTMHAAISVRGTDYTANFAADGSGSVHVFSGIVNIVERNSGRAETINPDERVTVSATGQLDTPQHFDPDSFPRWWHDD